MAGDPRLASEAAREEVELSRSRLELTVAVARIQEAKLSVTNAQAALGKAREKRDLAAKALSERDKEWAAQNALAATATRDRDTAASELNRIQTEAKAAGEELQKATAVAKATPEAALKLLDDLVAKAELVGRRKVALERAEAEILRVARRLKSSWLRPRRRLANSRVRWTRRASPLKALAKM